MTDENLSDVTIAKVVSVQITHQRELITLGNCSGCTGFSTVYMMIVEKSMTKKHRTMEGSAGRKTRESPW